MLMAFSRKICIESTYTEVQSLLTFKHLEGRQAGRQGQFSFSFQCLPGTQDPAALEWHPGQPIRSRESAAAQSEPGLGADQRRLLPGAVATAAAWGGGGLAWPGLSGRGRRRSSTMSLQYGAEETPLAGSYGAADSFPKDFGYGVEEEEEEAAAGGGGGAGAGGGCGPGGADSSKPRILLMGLRRSGKSSIQKVVFHKMSPNETLFLESTNKIYKDDISNSSFVNFQIWDFPGQMDFFDPTFDYEMIFRGTGALIYVIDAQDDYMEALTRLHITVSKAYKVNPDMNFEVFIHKVDGLSDDHKIETQRDIHQRANDDLADAGLEKLHLSFYLTSIYDHSIFEAFSKVVQKLIPQLPTLENLLNIFISNSGIEKAFLFDVVSKIYIATDSSPVDMQSYELCCDMIDVVIDVSCIYGLKEDGSGSAYDKESMAIIKLNNTTVLYLKEVTKFLALVCILREESFERKGLIDYNFHCFRKAIHEVFEVGVTSHRSCSHQTSAPSLKALAHNGTPRNAI